MSPEIPTDCPVCGAKVTLHLRVPRDLIDKYKDQPGSPQPAIEALAREGFVRGTAQCSRDPDHFQHAATVRNQASWDPPRLCVRCGHALHEHDENDLNCETCTVAGGNCANPDAYPIS